jgi:hypothetical protein
MSRPILCAVLILLASAQRVRPQQSSTLEKCGSSNVDCALDKQSSPGKSNQLVNRIVQYWTDFVEARRAAVHFAWTVDGDHENAGIYTDGGGSYLGVRAVHTVFKAGDFNLGVPAGAQGKQILYAPTTRPPNGSCLEMGTAYTAIAGQPTAVNVYAYDFCSYPTQFVYVAPVDDNFIRLYAGETVDGIAAYKIRIIPNETSLSKQTEWSGQLFNYVKQVWETKAVAHGFVTDLSGWSIFETLYQKGQCSTTLKPMKAVSIAYYDSSTDSWKAIADEMLPLRNSLRRGGNCFTDQDANNLASYKVNELQNAHGWEVVGTGH